VAGVNREEEKMCEKCEELQKQITQINKKHAGLVDQLNKGKDLVVKARLEILEWNKHLEQRILRVEDRVFGIK
jgi:peptidoglycan hydrolase CwlO-like protein